jgi:hypothetical protein
MIFLLECTNQGRIQDFKLWGAHFKKLRRAEEGAKFFGVFRVKNHDFTPKNHIFSNSRVARAGCAPPSPGSVPANAFLLSHLHFTLPWRRWLPVEWMLADVTSTPVFTVFYFTFVNRFFNRAHRLTFAQQYLCNGFQLQINSIDVDRYMYSIYTTVNAV